MKEIREAVLIVGSGGREHAIGWQIKKSPHPRELYFAPGNAGTSQLGHNVDIDINDVHKLAEYARRKKAFTIVGSEVFLEKGIANVFKEEKLSIFAPTQEAAQLETSKSWAIDFMKRHNIPHPISVIMTNHYKAMAFFENPVWKDVVIKTDGLAAGKGVFLPNSKEEALVAIKRIVSEEFDDGKKIIIQERLEGKEVSFMVVTDGKTIVPLPLAQDHKRLLENDKGPNTGGMGAFAPTSMDQELQEEIMNTIIRPTINGMREEGYPFQGEFFAGIMLTKDGPKLLEVNARPGDPETQAQMMILKSDFLTAAKNVARGGLSAQDIVFRNGAAVCVVLASEGYPDSPKGGRVIYGLESVNIPDMQVFHAGTRMEKGRIVTRGGRALSVTALGKNIEDARKKVYSKIGDQGIHFEGMQYRADIGV